MADRVNKKDYFYNIAREVASRSTCLRRHVGAVIVDKYNTIVATGYNGAPSGKPDCLELNNCYRNIHNIAPGSNYELCISVHAEANALLQAGKLARDCDMYIYSKSMRDGEWKPAVTFPCIMCSRMIVNANINLVHVKFAGEFTADEIYEFSLIDMEMASIEYNSR